MYKVCCMHNKEIKKGNRLVAFFNSSIQYYFCDLFTLKYAQTATTAEANKKRIAPV